MCRNLVTWCLQEKKEKERLEKKEQAEKEKQEKQQQKEEEKQKKQEIVA